MKLLKNMPKFRISYVNDFNNMIKCYWNLIILAKCEEELI